MAGRLLLNPQALLFESDTANVGFPLDRVIIERDVGGRVLFSDPEQPEWAMYVADNGILDHHLLQRRNHARLQVKALRQRQEGKRTLKLAGLFLVCFAFLALAVLFLSQWTVGFLVNRIPIGWEASLGKAAYEEIKEDIKPVQNPVLKSHLAALVDRLVPAASKKTYKFEIEIVDDPTPNAFALPGGRILVNTGLFDVATKPEQVAGVLAHEVAHITSRHGLRHVISSAGPYYVLKMFISDKQGFMSVVSQGSQFLIRQNFSRDHEREADELGWGCLMAANIDPRGLGQFLKNMAADPLIGKLERSPLKVLSSHPPTEERLQHLEDLWQNSTKKKGFVKLQPLPELVKGEE
jgi:Zn-dependent protease with chaperone function